MTNADILELRRISFHILALLEIKDQKTFKQIYQLSNQVFPEHLRFNQQQYNDLLTSNTLWSVIQKKEDAIDGFFLSNQLEESYYRINQTILSKYYNENAESFKRYIKALNNKKAIYYIDAVVSVQKGGMNLMVQKLKFKPEWFVFHGRIVGDKYKKIIKALEANGYQNQLMYKCEGWVGGEAFMFVIMEKQ